jgi:hypothetical protein
MTTARVWCALVTVDLPVKLTEVQASPMHACASCGPEAIVTAVASARMNLRVFMIFSTSEAMSRLRLNGN